MNLGIHRTEYNCYNALNLKLPLTPNKYCGCINILNSAVYYFTIIEIYLCNIHKSPLIFRKVNLIHYLAIINY